MIKKNNLRAYGQKNPLQEYKREAFYMFESMLENLKTNFVQRMAHLHVGAENAENLDIRKRQLQQIYATREDPAFMKYNSGTDIETKLKPVRAVIAPEDRDPKNPLTWGKVSRNELCPCGSKKKFKHCHGVLV